jgi:AcrR family transcriptional regulator
MTRQVQRSDFLATALDVLGREGHTGLKVGRLSRELGVTTGSLYHHFAGLPDLVDALLRHWEVESTDRTAQALRTVTDADSAIAALKQAALDLPHPAEAAIRAWSHSDPAVEVVQRRVDQHREDALALAISRLVGDEQLARELGIVGLTILTGFQQSGDPRDLPRLAMLLDRFEALVYASVGAASAAR